MQLRISSIYVIDAILKVIKKSKKIKKKYEIYNIGSGRQVSLKYFIKLLEEVIGKKAIKNFIPMQKGDVKDNYSSNKKITSKINFKPNFTLKSGLENFIIWYKNYYLYK